MIKAPPEKQWKLSSSWKVISKSLYPDHLSWKVRWINPDNHNHIYRLRPLWTLQEKCEPELKVNIYQNKNHILKEKPVLYSSVYLCTRFAYLYHATIECSVSRYYDMIWNHTAVSTSLFTDFPPKNFFNGHHCFSKYIADEKRTCRVNFYSL